MGSFEDSPDANRHGGYQTRSGPRWAPLASECVGPNPTDRGNSAKASPPGRSCSPMERAGSRTTFSGGAKRSRNEPDWSPGINSTCIDGERRAPVATTNPACRFERFRLGWGMRAWKSLSTTSASRMRRTRTHRNRSTVGRWLHSFDLTTATSALPLSDERMGSRPPLGCELCHP
jgi:hypothetical protein